MIRVALSVLALCVFLLGACTMPLPIPGEDAHGGRVACLSKKAARVDSFPDPRPPIPDPPPIDTLGVCEEPLN